MAAAAAAAMFQLSRQRSVTADTREAEGLKVAKNYIHFFLFYQNYLCFPLYNSPRDFKDVGRGMAKIEKVNLGTLLSGIRPSELKAIYRSSSKN
jgi:hypothetical protein